MKNWNFDKNATHILSPTAMIVSKLLFDDKKGEMLNRLKIKLGISEKEIYKLVSEL